MSSKVFKSITELGQTYWDSLVSKRFFLSYNYLATLEKACPQLNYRYVLVFQGDQLVSMCYFQIIPFYGSALRQYLPTNNSLFAKIYENTLAKVNTSLLVLGNIIFTCENGVLINEKFKDNANEYIDKSLRIALESLDKRPLGTMISENIKTVSPKLFCTRRFYPFKVEDRMELNLEEFESLDEYKTRLQSKYRLRIKNVVELNLKTEKIFIDKYNFVEFKSQIEELFLNVLENSKFKLTTISADYFYQFLCNIDRFKIKGYTLNGNLIGFICYFQLDTIIEVHYAGIDYAANQNSKIYNFMLIDMIHEAFHADIKKICYGRTAQELKSTLGAQPFPTLSSLKINNEFLNLFTPLFLKRMVPSQWIQRSPFKALK